MQVPVGMDLCRGRLIGRPRRFFKGDAFLQIMALTEICGSSNAAVKKRIARYSYIVDRRITPSVHRLITDPHYKRGSGLYIPLRSGRCAPHVSSLGLTAGPLQQSLSYAYWDRLTEALLPAEPSLLVLAEPPNADSHVRWIVKARTV